MPTKRKIYFNFFKRNQKILPIFFWPGWLEAISNGNWDFTFFGSENDFIAVLPYSLYRKGPLKVIANPPLTPFLGPWIEYPSNQKQSSKLAYERRVLKSLITTLPKFDLLNIQTHPDFKNVLPFVWEDFKQSTRYTYRLPLQQSPVVQTNWSDSTRRNYIKASKHLSIYPIDFDLFWTILSNTYHTKGLKLGVQKSSLVSAYHWLKQENRVNLWGAQDKEGECHAAQMLIWDDLYMYYFKGATLRQFKGSDGQTLLLVHAMERAAQLNLRFDFEGSMIKSVERYFSGFGPEQVPYFKIIKTDSILGRFLNWKL